MILINGNFLCRNLTGIERFAFETMNQLDNLVSQNDEIAILLPKNAKVIPEYKNIKKVISDIELTSFPKWDLFYFKKQCKKHNAIGLNFSNTAPLGKMCGYAFIHDIYAKDFPQDFVSFKEKLIKIYCRLNYWNISKNAKKVLTVSEFSKNQIQKAYKIDSDKIEVVPNGWEHFASIQKDDSIFSRYPMLQKGKFYFTLGSLQKRKNLKWICEYAQKNPNEIFAISGKVISGYESNELSKLGELKNIVSLGYVSDEEVKSLMSECKAFIFPSYYEGFGIPPLEALSVGAKIIVAKSASLPEIYEESAIYIDSNNSDCNLNELLQNCDKQRIEQKAKEVLSKYTYMNAAKKLYSIIKK